MAIRAGLEEHKTAFVPMVIPVGSKNFISTHQLNVIQLAYARIVGLDRPAAALMAAAADAYEDMTFGIPAGAEIDYTLIDPALIIRRVETDTVEAGPVELGTVEPGTVGEVSIPPPGSGLGYGGLTAEQRAVFIDWLGDPSRPIGRSYQELYVAHLEARLFDGQDAGTLAHGRMTSLQAAPAWRNSVAISRAILLGYYLYQDGPGLATWLATTTPTTTIFETGLSLQAQLGTPLTAAELGELMVRWELAPVVPTSEILRFRLDSLSQALDAEPLKFVRTTWTDDELQIRPWRCMHRDIRIGLPVPPVRALLEDPIREVLRIRPEEEVSETQTAIPESVNDGSGQERDRSGQPLDTPPAEGYVVLEFQQSRSEYFDYVLDVARRMEGFSQLMDEDRHIIYRVLFRKSKMRQFWRLWDYVQTWSSTRIYVDGEELEKWKVWPYSQYLR